MRMAARLGATCRAARRDIGFTLLDVATEAEVSHSTVHYFERGEWWVRETDAIVDAYARLCDTTPRELWQAAVDRDPAW